jgi:hypothetical protein
MRPNSVGLKTCESQYYNASGQKSNDDGNHLINATKEKLRTLCDEGSVAPENTLDLSRSAAIN